MKRILLAVLVLVLEIPTVKSQNYKDTLDIKLEKLYQQKRLPGFAVAVVNEEKILYHNSFGFADIENKKLYTSKTIQSIASVSKTMIGLAIAKLIDQGRLSLNTSINSILPYKVYHPKFPNIDITIKDLVTHTSALIDTENNYDSKGRYFVKETKINTTKLPQDDLVFINNHIATNKKRSLREHFFEVFSENGIWKSDSSWTNYKPGEHYCYSNLGANLAAHIVEIVAKQPYNKFVYENFFKPLKMNNMSWQQNEVEFNYLAKAYRTPQMIFSPIFGDNLYADGNIHSNLDDLSLYLIEMIKGYNGKSNFLESEVYQQLFSALLKPEVALTNGTKKFKNIGIFWMLAKDGFIYHNGGNPLGGTTYVRFDPGKNIGYILMSNYAVDTKESQLEFLYVWKNLIKYATQLK